MGFQLAIPIRRRTARQNAGQTHRQPSAIGPFHTFPAQKTKNPTAPKESGGFLSSPFPPSEKPASKLAINSPEDRAQHARVPGSFQFHLNLLVAAKFLKNKKQLNIVDGRVNKYLKKKIFPLNKKIRFGKISLVPPFKNKNSVSAEDYLKRIHEIIDEKGYARAVDIASALGISQSSVSSMVQKLAAEGLLNYEKYRGMTLTEEGKKVALAVHKRHEILKRFLSLIKVPQKAQERDIEGLEHHISNETVHAIAQLSDDLEVRAGKG